MSSQKKTKNIIGGGDLYRNKTRKRFIDLIL